MNEEAAALADFMAEDDIGLGGEFLAYMALRELPGTWRVLQNLLVPVMGRDVRDTEIDLALVHASGVYVLEVKEYSGWIYGSPRDYKWTQTLKGKHGKIHKNKFYNPLRQNYGHTQALKQKLAMLGSIPLHSIVVFSDHCEFKTQLFTAKTAVIHRRDLVSTLTRIARESGDCLGPGSVDAIYWLLKTMANPSQQRKGEHIKAVQAIASKENQAIRQPVQLTNAKRSLWSRLFRRSTNKK